MKIQALSLQYPLFHASTPAPAAAAVQKSNTSRQGGFLIDKTHNRSLISFTGIDSYDNADYGMLGRKISTALNFMQDNDVILAGSDLKEAKNDLLAALKDYPDVISRVFFIQDKKLAANFMIAKNLKDEYYIQNLSEAPVYKVSKDKVLRMNKTSSMLCKDAVFSFEKDGRNFFNVVKNENAQEKDLETCGIQIHDFSRCEQDALYEINRKNLERIGNGSKVLENKRKITFKDVGGLDEAIAELKESVIYPVKYPEAFNALNHGVILEGEPGTGKSLMAEAVSNEAGVHFIKLNGLELESKWVGESSANWRALFEKARKNEPCIIFIDEFDAVARKREGDSSSRHDDKVVNQILTLMSDIEKSSSRVYVLAATNKKELLDDAIVRSGRFGKTIHVPLPDEKGCAQILDIYTKDKNLDDDFSAAEFARQLHKRRASGSDIAAIVEEARKYAYKRENVFQKMESGTFCADDIKNIKLNRGDFENALNAIMKEEKRKMGFSY